MPYKHLGTRLAKTRADVFPESCILWEKEENSQKRGRVYVKDSAFWELHKELTREGLTSFEADVFIETLWKSEVNLDWRVSSSTVAESLGKIRTSVSRVMSGLQDMGILIPSLPVKRPPLWRFPTHSELIRKLEERREQSSVQDRDTN